MKDLVILVADKNAEFALKGAIVRHQSLGIRAIDFEVLVHPGRDGGARKTGPEILARDRHRSRHALLVLDFEGCGTELPNALSLEEQLDGRLAEHWDRKAKSIVIEPELDVWIWGSDNAVEGTIQWTEGIRLRDWLKREGHTFDANAKPKRPKEALEAALRVSSLPRSSALYRNVAQKISLRRCVDPAYIRLHNQLLSWFSV